jgi:hypothetical protein
MEIDVYAMRNDSAIDEVGEKERAAAKLKAVAENLNLCERRLCFVHMNNLGRAGRKAVS